LLCWADAVGHAQILQMLAALESLGERARPTPLLVDLARRHGRLVSP